MRVASSLPTKIGLSLICSFFLGCATIPPAAPELSAQLGNQLAVIESSHLTLLHRFFELKRNEVDRFIQDEWTPTFSEEVFSEPKIKEAWNTIVAENNPAERMKFLNRIGLKLQERINQKRLELIRPLDDLERQIEQELRSEYDQAMSINNTITSFLISASKISENQNRYLQMLGMSDEKIGKMINDVNDAVADLLKGGRDVAEKISMSEQYIKKLRELRNQFTQNIEDSFGKE